MSLFRDHVTPWQRDVLGDIQLMRENALTNGIPSGPHTPSTDWQNTVGDPVAAARSGSYSPGPPGGRDYQNSVSDVVEKNRSQPLPSSSQRPHGSSWAAHAGSTFGLSVPVPGGYSIGFGDLQQMQDNAARLAKGLATDFLFGQLFRSDEIEKVTDRVNQELETRGYLLFAFPHREHLTDANKNSGEFKIPFFENPQISEARSSNYATQSIINRNEPWRLFVGAQAKQLQLSFKLTLPHICQFALAYGSTEALSFLTDSIYYSDFQKNIGVHTHGKYQSLSTNNLDGEPYAEDVRSWVPANNTSSPVDDEKEKMFLAYVQHIIDKVRASVVGSVSNSNSVQAPPEVFLNFGTLYNNEPFIVKNYTINFDGGAGYDLNTLLPRVMEVKLSLEGYHQTNNGSSSTPLEGWDTILRKEGSVT